MKTKCIMLAILATAMLSCSDDDNKSPVGSPAISGFYETPANIPDNSPATPLTSLIVLESMGTIAHPERVSVTVELEHTFAGDLTLELIAPNGQSMPLIKRLRAATPNAFGLSANFQQGNLLRFNSAHESSLPVSDLSTDLSIPAGNYKPTGENTASPAAMTMMDMAEFLNGKNVNGNWALRVADYSGADTGMLIGWKIEFGEGALN